ARRETAVVRETGYLAPLPAALDRDAVTAAGAPAAKAVRVQQRPVGVREQAGLVEHADPLVVAETAAHAAGAARILLQPQLLDQDGVARLRELDRKVARVRDDVDDVGAVCVPPPARAAAQHLAAEEEV